MVVQTCRSSKGDPERQAEAGGTAESVERNPLFFKARERRKSSTLFLFGQCGAAAISFSHLVSLLLRSPFGRLSPPLSSRSCPLSGLPLPTDEPNPRNADEKPQEKKKKKNLQRRVAARAEGGASPPPPPPAPVKKDRSNDQLIFASEQSLRYVGSWCHEAAFFTFLEAGEEGERQKESVKMTTRDWTRSFADGKTVGDRRLM